jgi:hypothetical protein
MEPELSPPGPGSILPEQPGAGSARFWARSELGPATARVLPQETLRPVFGLPVKTFA